jgi:adenosylcobinamide-GDP ribazoletransferase
MRPFLIALQFLTRLPVRFPTAPAPDETGRSLLYYPLVGLLLGLSLVALAWAFAPAPTLLRAALVLAAWVVLTGAMHLDGLADSADAWVGGHGDRERTLRIMKDPACGPMGAVALALVLLVKFAALSGLDADGWAMLAFIPAIARSAVPLLFLTTPYVRADGLGTPLARHPPRRASVAVVGATVAVAAMFTGARGVVALVAVALAFVLLRALMMRRIGGATGDTTGALIEIVETVLLLATALSSTHSSTP